MRQLITATHVVVPGREPHRNAINNGVRRSEMVAYGKAGNEYGDAKER